MLLLLLFLSADSLDSVSNSYSLGLSMLSTRELAECQTGGSAAKRVARVHSLALYTTAKGLPAKLAQNSCTKQRLDEHLLNGKRCQLLKCRVNQCLARACMSAVVLPSFWCNAAVCAALIQVCKSCTAPNRRQLTTESDEVPCYPLCHLQIKSV